jgi:acetyl esterase/lipase
VAPPVLDPQIQAVLDEQAAAGTKAPGTVTPEELRAQFVRQSQVQWGDVSDEMHSIEDADADGVPIRIYRPVETDEPSMALVYFHGGGWVVGSIETHDGITRAIARRVGIVVVSVDYRLAPEHPFPAALEDAWTATQWVSSHADELKLDVDRIGVGGDSSGGNLAAVVARRGRDHAVPIALQLLLYPAISYAFDTPSYSYFSEGYGLTRDGMRWYWDQYLGESDGTNPDVSPSQAADLRRLPRAIVVTAEADVLRDEAESYAQRMFLSTVETEGYRYDGMVHGFLRMAGKVERSNAAFDELAESIKTMLAKTWRD